jgi:hypothetical protein
MVSFDRLVEKARLHAVERGEVGIEQEPKSTEGDGLR